MQMRKSNKRALFFEETLKLIYEKGFKATTIRDIADRLNFKEANVYNYVDSKQALLEGYIFDIQNEFHTAMNHIIDSTYLPNEKLRLVISSYIQITSKRPYEQALFMNDWRNLKEPRLQEFINSRKAYEEKLKTIIEAGVSQGQFRVLNLTLTTQTIMATLRWLYILYIGQETNLNPIEVEKQLTDFIFTGIHNE